MTTACSRVRGRMVEGTEEQGTSCYSIEVTLSPTCVPGCQLAGRDTGLQAGSS